MMQIVSQNNPQEFLKKYGAWLEKNEAEHNLILSLCQAAEKKIKDGGKAEINCWALLDGKEVIVTAIQTPPHNLVLSKASRPEIEPLAEKLAEEKCKFPGIVGPSDVASAFANKWTQLTGQRSVEYMDQIIYVLKSVLMPPPVEGSLRLAKASEAPLIGEWISAFAKDALPKAEQVAGANALKAAEEKISAQRIAVWTVKGKPVSQAAATGTSSIARINLVYTPPEQRGHGYASATVAHLTRQQLEQGKKMCCLYADARNPVSNSIYRKIGYEFVGRSSLYVLEAAA